MESKKQRAMAIEDKMIYAAAFAGALQAARKGGFEGDPDSAAYGHWSMQTALDAANAAGQAVDALATAEDFIEYMAHKAEGEADPARAAQAAETAGALAMLGDAIAAFRAEDLESFAVDCPYDHEDGACGEHPECMQCGEEGDDGDACDGDCVGCCCDQPIDPPPPEKVN